VVIPRHNFNYFKVQGLFLLNIRQCTLCHVCKMSGCCISVLLGWGMLVSFKFLFLFVFVFVFWFFWVGFRGVCYGLFYALLQDGQLKGFVYRH